MKLRLMLMLLEERDGTTVIDKLRIDNLPHHMPISPSLRHPVK